MRFNFALVSSFLLASAVLADRRHMHRRAQSLDRLQQRNDGTIAAQNDDTFAGVVVGTNPASDLFSWATGKFVVPDLRGSSGDARAVIGINTAKCGGKDVSLQAGVLFGAKGDKRGYVAVGGFLPDDPVRYAKSDLPISPGDHIEVSVWMTSASSGGFKIVNITTKKVLSKIVQSSEASFCEGNAMWIVSKEEQSLVDFGQVTFYDVQGKSQLGEYHLSNGFVPYNIPGKAKTTTDPQHNVITIQYQ